MILMTNTFLSCLFYLAFIVVHVFLHKLKAQSLKWNAMYNEHMEETKRKRFDNKYVSLMLTFQKYIQINF